MKFIWSVTTKSKNENVGRDSLSSPRQSYSIHRSTILMKSEFGWSFVSLDMSIPMVIHLPSNFCNLNKDKEVDQSTLFEMTYTRYGTRKVRTFESCWKKRKEKRIGMGITKVGSEKDWRGVWTVTPAQMNLVNERGD